MNTMSSLSNRAAAALTAFALSIILIGGTVSVPAEAQARTASYVGVIA